MQQPLPNRAPTLSAPSFYLTGRQPFSPGVLLLATVAAVVTALASVLYVMGQLLRGHLTSGRPDASRSASAFSADDKDDPNQVDTIVLGDPADAPVPGHRGDHVSPVHATILVRLPRFGNEVGLIPNTPAGQLLYAWLAAFNQANASALSNVLPSAAPAYAVDAQMDLRQQTGGFNLLSAKEVQPGVLVFRLRDQTPTATECLGTLQLIPKSTPAAIATFSLRAVPSPCSNDLLTWPPPYPLQPHRH